MKVGTVVMGWASAPRARARACNGCQSDINHRRFTDPVTTTDNGDCAGIVCNSTGLLQLCLKTNGIDSKHRLGCVLLFV